jgi:copper(I)-binding protein
MMHALRPGNLLRRARTWPWPLALLALVGALLLAGPGRATGPALITVEDPWVRGTVEGQTGSGAYMRLTSSEDAQLVGAASPVAEHVEIHEMRTVNDMMTMRRVERLALPAHASVALDHDYHVMFIGLRHQLVVGQTVPITLQVQDAQGRRHAVEVLAPVRALNTVKHPAEPATAAPGAQATPHG